MAACSSSVNNSLRCSASVVLPIMVKMYTRRALPVSPAAWRNCNRTLYQLSCGGTPRLCSQRHASSTTTSTYISSLGGQKVLSSPDTSADVFFFYPLGYYCTTKPASCFGEVGRSSYSTWVSSSCSQTPLFRCQQASPQTLLQGGTSWNEAFIRQQVTETSPSSVAPAFVVMKFDKDGNVESFEKKKTELCQELSLQARDLRFQHSTSLTTRNNCIIIRMESLKAVVTPHSVLVFDFRGVGLERWLVLDLASQLASPTHSLPFEFKALEAILQHRVNTLQGRLHEVHPVIMDTLESLVDPKLLSADRSKLHVLLQNSKSLSELETDIKVFKDSLLKIMDEEEILEELCLTKWTDPRVFEESSLGIDHAEEMELLLENYYMQAKELADEARELRGLIDDSESVIFINLDSHRNVMMRLNLQLTMGTFSLSLFGLMGVAFGMNLESSFEEDPRVFWLVTGFMFLGSGLIWRRLLSFLGRNLEPSTPPQIPPVWKRNLKPPEVKTGVR